MKLDFDIKTKGANLDFDMKDTTVISQSAKKEIVVVDIQKMLEKQDTTLFMDLSRRYANGEIVIVGSLHENTAIVNAVGLLSETTAHWVVTSGAWGEPMLEGGEFKPLVEVYGLECDGEKIVIGSGSIENPDLAEYVKKTDYATENKAGVITANPYHGLKANGETGALSIVRAEPSIILAKSNGYQPLTAKYLDYAVKVGVTTNSETLTDDEKLNACAWLGALPKYTGTGGIKIYGISNDGTQKVFDAAYAPYTNCIPMYPSTGRLQTKTPAVALDCANKDFVENLPTYFADTITEEQQAKWRGMFGALQKPQKDVYSRALLIGIDGNGVEYTAPLSYDPVAYAVPRYYTGALLRTNKPVNPKDCANKEYVDENFTAKLYKHIMTFFDNVWDVMIVNTVPTKMSSEQFIAALDDTSTLVRRIRSVTGDNHGWRDVLTTYGKTSTHIDIVYVGMNGFTDDYLEANDEYEDTVTEL